MTTEAPQIPIEHVADERLPLAINPHGPDMPGVWLLLAVAVLVILVCVLGGCLA